VHGHPGLALGGPKSATTPPHDPQPMPFAAQGRHQYWSVDVRCVEDHALGTSKPTYVISILENFSRALTEMPVANLPLRVNEV
jgi:hypothetical protein